MSILKGQKPENQDIILVASFFLYYLFYTSFLGKLSLIFCNHVSVNSLSINAYYYNVKRIYLLVVSDWISKKNQFSRYLPSVHRIYYGNPVNLC